MTLIAKMDPNYTEGRPKKFNEEKISHAVDLLRTHSYTQVEKMTGISKATLYRAKKKEMTNNEWKWGDEK